MMLTLLVTFALMSAGSAAANTLVVAEVHAGDLVEFEGGFTVHLTGVVVPGRTTRIGRQAFDFTKRRLEGKRVAVFTWTTDNTAAGIVFGTDGLASAKILYGRDLAHDIAAELLERGFAEVDPDRLPAGCDHYLEIERRARDRKIGIWVNS
jgi:endonuclease YncB( thermonuclease family)